MRVAIATPKSSLDSVVIREKGGTVSAILGEGGTVDATLGEGGTSCASSTSTALESVSGSFGSAVSASK